MTPVTPVTVAESSTDEPAGNGPATGVSPAAFKITVAVVGVPMLIVTGSAVQPEVTAVLLASPL